MVNDPELTITEDKEERIDVGPTETIDTKVEKNAAKPKKRLPCWCWYCDREFKDLQVLIHHQRSRHFKCPYCHKRLHSASGLLVHAAQVHKDREPLDRVPNALEGHDGGEWEIYGMRGVPEEDLERWRRGLPMIKREARRGMTGVGLVSILAAQKQAQVPVSYYQLPPSSTKSVTAELAMQGWEEGQIRPEFYPLNVGTIDASEITYSDASNKQQRNEVASPMPQNTNPVNTTNVRIVATGKVLKRDKSIFD